MRWGQIIQRGMNQEYQYICGEGGRVNIKAWELAIPGTLFGKECWVGGDVRWDFFCRVWSHRLSVWRSVGTRRGVNYLARNYMLVGKVQDQCIEARKVLLTNKDWKGGGNYWEWAMGSTWWKWLEGSIYIFWMYPKESWGDIRDAQKQCQVLPWPNFIHPQRVERYYNVAEKESSKLAEVRRRSYVRVVEVKII